MMGKRGKAPTITPYLTEMRPGHPVAHADGRVRIHRAELYDKIGPGKHPCHWCGRAMSWSPHRRTRLVADHIDGDTWNNDKANLVPSCESCNLHRVTRGASHCEHGHEWTDANTYHRPDGTGRACRECSRLRELRRVRVR